MTREQELAYALAAWVCLRQDPIQRLITVKVWCDANQIDASEAEQVYMLEHWRDYVTID